MRADILKAKHHKDKVSKFAAWEEFGIVHVSVHWKGIVRGMDAEAFIDKFAQPTI